MKEIDELIIPEDLRFAKNHEWKGWLIVIRPSDESEFETLMASGDYIGMLKGA